MVKLVSAFGVLTVLALATASPIGKRQDSTAPASTYVDTAASTAPESATSTSTGPDSASSTAPDTASSTAPDTASSTASDSGSSSGESVASSTAESTAASTTDGGGSSSADGAASTTAAAGGGGGDGSAGAPETTVTAFVPCGCITLGLLYFSPADSNYALAAGGIPSATYYAVTATNETYLVSCGTHRYVIDS